ncbi:hypothetical protein D5086_028894 [Populus alba]|uniref:Uncharacterized protein n=1 Tax=Populus alba TaxID=43335 RepID=A0ACC4AS00_POPAL
MAMPWGMALWMANMVWVALIGWVSSCLTVADELASSLRTGDIGFLTARAQRWVYEVVPMPQVLGEDLCSGAVTCVPFCSVYPVPVTEVEFISLSNWVNKVLGVHVLEFMVVYHIYRRGDYSAEFGALNPLQLCYECLQAYAHHGCGMEAIELFEDMQGLGFKPNDVSYVELLSACSHAGLVDKGLNYFDELRRDNSIQLREDHHACLVDLCGRAGRLKEAYDFIKQLGTKASSSIWGGLLAGCNAHGDLEIGHLAAKELEKEDPENAGTYLLLSNIYASVHDIHAEMKKVEHVPNNDFVDEEDFSSTQITKTS